MSQFELRLAALSKLVDVKTAAVEERLSEEFRRVAKVLGESAEYDELSEALKTLAVLVPRFHMATLPMLEKFVRAVSIRTLTEGGTPISGSRLRYRSAESLTREAIEVADKVRYVHTEQLVDFLLELSRAPDKEVRAKAEGGLKALATFDLDVFYGEPPRGAEPQMRLVTHLSKLKDEELRTNANVILQILGTTLSPAIEGTSWSYQSITIRRGSVQSDGGVAIMRADAIELAKRMYALDESVNHRMQVLRTLNTATRREGRVTNADTLAMFERDAIKVLEFARDLVKAEPLPVVQSIEHLAYWDYYHADSKAIKDKALEVRDVLDAHSEYQIYKQLIGFEGIFGKWEDLRRSDGAWDYSDTKRREAARQYLEEINDATYEVWRDRILKFSQTRSDDLAMFPVYYDFLESIGRERSRLALELLSTIHETVMEPFFIALMRGLWTSGSSVKVDAIAKDWIASGRHLTTIAKSFYGVGMQRLDTLTAVIDRAAAVDDREALIQTAGVAASLFAEGAVAAKSIFLRSLRELAKHDDARWAKVIWFRKDFRVLVGAMEPSERAEILAMLTSLPELDYQAEDVLYEIAQFDLHVVLSFLIGRLKHARALAEKRRELDAGSSDQFEPVPYQLPKLGEVIAREPSALLSALRGDFDEEVRFMFSYRGARLVKSAFPTFGEPLAALLLEYVGTGGEADIEFVVGILRAYDGSASILDICKAIVKAVPERSGVWNEVAAAIETTGVVRGEYGMVQAYEQNCRRFPIGRATKTAASKLSLSGLPTACKG